MPFLIPLNQILTGVFVPAKSLTADTHDYGEAKEQ